MPIAPLAEGVVPGAGLALLRTIPAVEAEASRVEGDERAGTGRYVDLVEAGIIDPTKVVRLALENAVSVAGVLLLTEATMIEVREPRPEAASPGPEAF